MRGFRTDDDRIVRSEVPLSGGAVGSGAEGTDVAVWSPADVIGAAGRPAAHGVDDPTLDRVSVRLLSPV